MGIVSGNPIPDTHVGDVSGNPIPDTKPQSLKEPIFLDEISLLIDVFREQAQKVACKSTQAHGR